MFIKGQEPNEYVPIHILDHHVGNCFLAALVAYFNYLYNNGFELMQFSWYYSFKRKNVSYEIKLINFDEVCTYVANRFGVSLVFLNKFKNINIDHLIQNELKQGRAIGATVDYNKCDWTKGMVTKEYVYHFILLIGYSDKYYWCVDNETISVQMIEKGLFEEMIREVLLFVDNGGINIIYDYQQSFLRKDYWKRREKMLHDITEIKKILQGSLRLNDLYSISSKLRLIADNYNDFGFFLKEIVGVNGCEDRVANLENLFKMLSFACLKLLGGREDQTHKIIDNYIEKIVRNEVELRTYLKGYNWEE